VILVDNGSSDRTMDLAQAASSGLQFRILERKKVTISALRNLGAREARGEYLAFLDADCLAPRPWLTEAARLLEREAAGVVGAPYSIPADSSWVGRIWSGHQETKLGKVAYVPGGDFLIRREQFLEIGGFGESIQTNEDYELCQRALRAGISVEGHGEISVCHLGTPQTLLDFYRKQRWHGRHVFRVFLQGLPRLHNFKSVAYACSVLLCIVGVIAGISLAAFGMSRAVLLISAASLIGLPALFGAGSVWRRKAWPDLPGLTVLFLVFGLARVACLIGLGTDRIRSQKTAAVSAPTDALAKAAAPDR